MQTVTNAVVQEVINNTGLSWRDAVAWCDNNLLPQWRTRPQQQAYDKNGDPDKTGGVDHQNDASTYPIVYEMPVVKAVAQIQVSMWGRR